MAGASTFASVTVGLVFFAARWGPSRTLAVDGSSVFAALADLTLVVAELVLDDAGVGSIGRLAAVLLGQPSAHASMLVSGGERQLQPTRVAARTPMRSVLMLIPHKGPEFRSHFLRRSNNVALTVYLLRKSINCLLNARSFAAASFAWLMPTYLSIAVGSFRERSSALLNRSICNSTIITALPNIVATMACAPDPGQLRAPALIRMPISRNLSEGISDARAAAFQPISAGGSSGRASPGTYPKDAYAA